MNKFCILIILAGSLILSDFADAGFYGNDRRSSGFGKRSDRYSKPYFKKRRTKSKTFLRVNGEFTSPITGDMSAAESGVCASCCSRCSVEVDVDAVELKDVYDNISGASIEFGLQKRANLEYAFGLLFLSGDSKTVRAGKFGNITDIDASYGEYNENGIYLAVRNGFGNGKGRFNPYIWGSIGMSLVDAINVSYLSADKYFDASELRMYDDSLIFKGAFGIGLGILASDNLEFGAEFGLAYQSKLETLDEDLSQLGLESINDGEGVAMLPVRFFGRYNF